MRFLSTLFLAAVFGPATAQPAPPAPPPAPAPAAIEFRTVALALAALKARDGNGTVVTTADGWVTINEPLASAQWSFTPPDHEAYPAVVRRTVRRTADGKVSVETVTVCEAATDPCGRLLAQFEAMNDRITQSARARARQGSTAPR